MSYDGLLQVAMKKGILKNAGHQDSAGTPTKKHLEWDEPNLELNEAERPPGGYMKIDEPKTPYHHGGASEEEEDEHEGAIRDAEIAAALEKAKTEKPAASKADDFAAKRRQHYNREERDVLKKVKAKKAVSKEPSE